MRSASIRPVWGAANRSVRSRSVSLVLVVVIHALLLFMLLRLAPAPPPPQSRKGTTLIDLLPEREAERAEAERGRPAARANPARAAERRPAAAPVRRTAPPVSDPASIWSQVVPLTREELAAADIGAMAPPADGGGGRGDGAGESAMAHGGGNGPGGERLFDADWYKKPTDAELAGYLPGGTPREGWGMIACRTVPNFRVEDCREIGQSPPGSGLARAVREAAWQFRVLPPRIGGRPLIGAWVRIRIEYTASGMK